MLELAAICTVAAAAYWIGTLTPRLVRVLAPEEARVAQYEAADVPPVTAPSATEAP
jgi:hypothetical protein